MDCQINNIKEGFMVINHNMSAAYANRSLKVKEGDFNSNIEKLSSGMKINKAGDDASGLAVSEKLRSQVRGLNQASRNIANGVSFIQTTEGYLQETQDIINRMRELAVQSANGIYSDQDRTMIQVEVSQLVDEVNRIASHAQFNGMNMLLGAFSRPGGTATPTNSMWLQVGANMDQRKQLFIGTMTAMALKLEDVQKKPVSIATPDEANKLIGQIDDALQVVSKQRADLGAYQNRFTMAVKGVDIAAENLQSAESTIRDTDMAAEMVEYAKNNILIQAGTAMLAQANTKTQSVLRLLG